jgi:hypothetical protein
VDVDDDTARPWATAAAYGWPTRGSSHPKPARQRTATPQPVLMTAGGVLLGVGELRAGVLHPRKVFM